MFCDDSKLAMRSSSRSRSSRLAGAGPASHGLVRGIDDCRNGARGGLPGARAHDATEAGVTMRVVVAPDKFKGSATAVQVAAALGTGLRRGRPGLEVAELPVADRGDGTAAAAIAAGVAPVPVTGAGPTGAPCQTPVQL